MQEKVRRFTQISFLSLVSVAFLYSAPEFWPFLPDSGVYIGSAQSIVHEGRFWFNGHPNLLVYPGFPLLLGIPVALFGTDFHVLHVFSAGIAISALWLASAYFSMARYGLAGAAVPFVLACVPISQNQAFLILSDGAFLAITFCALLLWRRYTERSDERAGILCLALVAFAPLVRFQGVLLCGAFFLAVVLRALKQREASPRSLALPVLLGLSTFLPFALWTLRNFLLFTPDTFNMANAFFFGQKGLSMYAPGFAKAEWIEQEWLYGPYRVLKSLRELGPNLLGPTIASWLASRITPVVVCLLVAAGTRFWFGRATNLERFYVLASLAFHLQTLVSGRSLHTVPRYWLPLLPFLTVSAAGALQLLYETLKRHRVRYLLASVIALLVAVIAYDGVIGFQTWNAPNAHAGRKTMSDAIEKSAAFVRSRTSPTVAIATTDTGLMPLALGRPSYPVLNDKSHLYTLERVVHYHTEYLVILCAGRHARAALKMVVDLPQIFGKQFQVDRNRRCPAVVYDINLRAARRYLSSR